VGNFAQPRTSRLRKGREVHTDIQVLGHASDSIGASRSGTPGPYESPRVIVIGKVRDVTTGNASSGNADANSQYYW
jgi:hypothetical protein